MRAAAWLITVPMAAALLALAGAAVIVLAMPGADATSGSSQAALAPTGITPVLLAALGFAAALVSLSGWMSLGALRRCGRRCEQLRQLVRRLDAARENDRTAWSQALHDDAAQRLVSTRLLVDTAADALVKDPAMAQERLSVAVERLSSLSGEMRRLSQALRTPVLDSLGLAPALQELAAGFTARTGVPCHVRVLPTEDAASVPPPVTTAFYRVAQEALDNVLAHARATTIDLLLASRHDGLQMQIDDDGIGFDVPTTVSSPTATGLRGLRERLAAVGGWMDITSRPGRTSLSASWSRNRRHHHAALQ